MFHLRFIHSSLNSCGCHICKWYHLAGLTGCHSYSILKDNAEAKKKEEKLKSFVIRIAAVHWSVSHLPVDWQELIISPAASFLGSVQRRQSIPHHVTENIAGMSSTDKIWNLHLVPSVTCLATLQCFKTTLYYVCVDHWTFHWLLFSTLL